MCNFDLGEKSPRGQKKCPTKWLSLSFTLLLYLLHYKHQKEQSMSYGSYGSYSVPKKSYSYSMSSGNVKASKTSKNMKVPGADSNKLAKKSAEMFIARNFARSVHKVITDISGEDLPIDFQFDAGGGGDRNGLMPARYVDKCVQVNTGPSELITSLLTAKNEYQINEALKKDFTKVVEKLAPSDSGGGSGSGFQVYFKGVEVLSIGAGGGGGYEQVDEEKESSQSRSKSRKHEKKNPTGYSVVAAVEGAKSSLIFQRLH
eukprot:scaffold10495_cov97-Skeletonema_dohrnii-CCMP3373.AAC.1